MPCKGTALPAELHPLFPFPVGLSGLEPETSPLSEKGGDPGAPSGTPTLLRLRPSYQPHLWRLPPFRVKIPTSGVANSHDVTGGVYKARERIHRSIADLRLLATPSSCRRVAACNLNWGRLSRIRSGSRLRFPLYRPL